MLNRKNMISLSIGVILAIISVWQIAAAQKGLDVITLHSTNPPVTIITPSDAATTSHPTVLIAHGFAGSAVLMRGFALTLAHAGYTTISWDFQGHGANSSPLLQTSESNRLLQDAESSLSEADITSLIDTQRVAILGHSMGSGVAISYGIAHPQTYATIAISPMGQSVSPTLPHNLLLMAGSLEPQFVSSANKLLAMAGGVGGDPASGTARKLQVIPNVEHITILFSPTAQSAARTWLDGTFGTQPGASNYTDHRILWFALGIMGFVCLSVAGVNSLQAFQAKPASVRPLWLRLVALVGGGVGATLILWLLSLFGIKISQLFGLLVGGYIIIWFGLAGVISMLISRPHLSMPKLSALIKGLVAFIALWLGVGLLGNFVWLPWLLIPSRLILWIPASIISLPYFLAVGEMARDSKTIGQIGWWLAQVVVVIGGLYLAIQVNPEVGFIFLILPVIPIMLGLQSLAISPKQGSWAFALPGALFTAWLLIAVFPLQ